MQDKRKESLISKCPVGFEPTTHDLWDLRVSYHIVVQAATVAAAILAGLIGLFMLKSGTLTEGVSMEFCLTGNRQNLGLTG